MPLADGAPCSQSGDRQSTAFAFRHVRHGFHAYEKGYRSWKQDLSTDYTMLEGGLGRFVKLDKPDFVGKDAIAVSISEVSTRLS